MLPCKCLTLLVTFQAITDLSCEDSYDCLLPYKESGALKVSNGVTQLVSSPVGSIGLPVPDSTERRWAEAAESAFGARSGQDRLR